MRNDRRPNKLNKLTLFRDVLLLKLSLSIDEGLLMSPISRQRSVKSVTCHIFRIFCCQISEPLGNFRIVKYSLFGNQQTTGGSHSACTAFIVRKFVERTNSRITRSLCQRNRQTSDQKTGLMNTLVPY